MATFNKDMMCLARELRAMSQEQLAEALNISQSKISKFESGNLVPNDDELQRMSERDVLDVPVEFFFHPGPRRAMGSSCIFHRKKQSTRVKDLRTLHAQFAYLRIQVEELLSKIDFHAEIRIHRIDIDAFDDDAEQIAEIVRRSWGLPSGPIANLTEAIERAGGIVIKTAFEVDDVDAMSYWPDGLPPIFFVNAKKPGDRLRFSLAHELGHLVMHNVPTGDMESQADRFASALLMPRTVIGPELSGRLSIQKLAAMKPRWLVSIQALVRCAFDIEAITERQYRNTMMQISKLGWRKNEPLPVKPESPSTLAAVIRAYQEKLGYSLEDLARLTVTKRHAFERQFFGTENDDTPRLRLTN